MLAEVSLTRGGISACIINHIFKLVFNGRLANRGLTSFVKEANGVIKRIA